MKLLWPTWLRRQTGNPMPDPSTHIPFLDLTRAHAELQAEIEAALCAVARSGWYIGGVPLAAFEAEFADFCGSNHTVGVGSGLEALRLSLVALEIGAGDEVIVPCHTFIATYLAVMAVGAVPVPVTCGQNYLIDPAAIEPAITPHTKAVLPVHLYGQCCDIDAIQALVATHDLRVIYDAAQAHGAHHQGKPIGGAGDAVCWSFYPGKNLGALGDGGAVTTHDAALAKRIRRLANYGSEAKYHHVEIGTNSRLDPMQAAVLSVKLRHLDAWNARRRQVAEVYHSLLKEALPAEVILPALPDEADAHVWHLFAIQVPDRDKVQQQLKAKSIQTQIHYPVLATDHPCFPALQAEYQHQFAHERAWCNRLLSLPMSPHHTAEKIEQVAQALVQCF